MKHPLVIRPAYNEAPTATAELPTGGPADRGRSLDSDIPGTSTFVKPLDDHGTDDTSEPGSIYRKDGPRDLAKPQEGDDSIDHSDASPGYMGLGEKDPDDYSKTKYPYRNEKPDTKNAADANFVAQLHILESKTPMVLTYQARTEARVASLVTIADRVAATAEQILSGLNPKFIERSKEIQAQVKRVDARNMRWIFNIQGASGKQYAVKLKAMRPRKNTTKLSKMDLEVSCSCPAWQWQGPEHHAKQDNYQLGKLQGTASTPDIRDPNRHNNVCKHVAAVLNMTREWEIPVARPNIKKR